MHIMLVYGFLLAGCKNIFSPNKTKTSLPGTYVNQSAGNYSRAFDTLIIEKKGINGNAFSIERRVAFQRFKHGVFQSREYHLELWMCIYDETTNVLTETKRGRMITYAPEKKKLYLGNNTYFKLNK